MPKRNNKKRQKYSMEQFVNTLCRGCDLCDSYVDPSKCYEVYKTNTRGFIENIYKRLIRIKIWPFGYESDAKSIVHEKEVFKNIFCSSGCCTPQKDNGAKNCSKLEECLDEFRIQIISSSEYEENGLIWTKENNTRRKKRKNDVKKVVVQPYATFIMSKDETFRKIVKEIIYGKDEDVGNAVEQNRTKEFPATACTNSD